MVVVVIAVRYNKTEAAAATKTCHPEDDDGGFDASVHKTVNVLISYIFASL